MPHKVAIIWSQSATADLYGVIEYIAEQNPVAAQSLLDEIREKVGGLVDNPQLYALSGRAEAYRQITLRENFLVYYQVLTEAEPAAISVVAVVHARRQWP